MADWLAFVVLAVLALAGAGLWAQRSLSPKLAGVFMVGLFLRVVGTIVRLRVIEDVYSGVGDAGVYFNFGQAYAELIRSLDFGFITGAGVADERWWGTQFVRSVTGFVVFFTGDSIRACSLAFALFAFTGLVLCVRGFGKVFGEEAEVNFARLVWLWPSLWFWPSSIGKEALMLLATGITVWGYLAKEQPRWTVVIFGLLATAAVRPHVAAVGAGAILVAESLGPGTVFTPRRLMGLLIASVLVVYSVRAGLSQLGLGDADLEGVQEHFEFRAGQTEQGGSQIATSKGWASIPMAFVTILTRPFIWEARGMALLSAVEIFGFWLVVARQHRNAWMLLKNWRKSSFTRFGLIFVLGVSLMYGLAFSNLGIIARQRAVILPYLLALITWPHFRRAESEGGEAEEARQANGAPALAPIRRARA